MNKAKVYFTGLRTDPGKNLLDKLEKLVTKAGMLDIDFNKKFAAIKIHFGEPGNLAYIRPNFAARIVNIIQKKGGLPFLTDCNTLYKGRRSNAVDHLLSAMENGFNPMAVGCNVIIADGVRGTDYREIEVNLNNCKTAKIGSAIADSDIIISVNHFKGHEAAGFGGCLKNIGMGSGSIGGKLVMHSSSKPRIVRENCTGCGLCENNCAYDAVKLDSENRAVINYEKCVGCGQCIAVCRYDAAQVNWNSKGLGEKIAEYALAVIKDKPNFHINFLMNISPNCDCWPNNDMSIVPDIGILASFDPVALDRASVDLVNEAPFIKESVVGGEEYGKDKFKLIFPNTDWKTGLDYAEKIGLGLQDYELIKID